MAKKKKEKKPKAVALTLKELKELLADHISRQFWIILNGGLGSRKTLRLQKSNGLVSVKNHIDESVQRLTWLQLMDPNYTNIGRAIKNKAFIINNTD